MAFCTSFESSYKSKVKDQYLFESWDKKRGMEKKNRRRGVMGIKV